MKITIVGQYYWPENFLVNDIAEELSKRGHEVTMLTGLPDYATNYVPEAFKKNRRRKETRNGVQIIRVPIIARRTGLFFRALNYVSFFATSSLYVLFNKGKLSADIVIAYQTAPVLMGNAAILLKKMLGIPLFFYCLDIWPDQMKIWGVKETNPIYKLVHRYSKYAYGSGDLVGVTSKPFESYLVNVNQVAKDKIVYLPQHASPMTSTPFDPEKENTDFIFAGNIGDQQNVECLLYAVAQMKTEKPFTVHIYGSGTAFDKCVALKEKLALNDKVIFYGRVDKSELEAVYPKMDAFLLTLCSEEKIGFAANTVPAKFQGYLSAGKPIIAAIDGGAKEIIEEIGCGLVVPADDAAGLAGVMDHFTEHKSDFALCGEKGRAYFQTHYDKEHIIDQWEEILAKLVKMNKVKKGKKNDKQKASYR